MPYPSPSRPKTEPAVGIDPTRVGCIPVNEIGPTLSAHPWWIVAGVAIAVFVAGWIIVGGELLEHRYKQHMFGRR